MAYGQPGVSKRFARPVLVEMIVLKMSNDDPAVVSTVEKKSVFIAAFIDCITWWNSKAIFSSKNL